MPLGSVVRQLVAGFAVGLPAEGCVDCGKPARADEDCCPECGGSLVDVEPVTTYDWGPPY